MKKEEDLYTGKRTASLIYENGKKKHLSSLEEGDPAKELKTASLQEHWQCSFSAFCMEISSGTRTAVCFVLAFFFF